MPRQKENRTLRTGGTGCKGSGIVHTVEVTGANESDVNMTPKLMNGEEEGLMNRVVFGASVQGASHIRSGMECQDSCKRLYCSDGSIIMAVADGHGSKNCPYSKTGSSIAVKVFCKAMSKYIRRFSDSPEQLLTYLNREGETKVAR